MSKLFLRRSDNIIQRYNINRKNLGKYGYQLSKSRIKGHTRTRKVYSHAIKLHKIAIKPQVIQEKEYENVIKQTVDMPIHDHIGQVHVRLKAIKDGRVQVADGYSHRLNLDTQYKRARDQAVDHALSEMGFASINDFYPEMSESGSPDSIRLLSIDYIYILKKRGS